MAPRWLLVPPPALLRAAEPSRSGATAYHLTAGLLVVAMLGGTLPIPLYVLWENQMGLGLLIAGLSAEYVALPARSVFWFYLGLCALALAACSASSAAWRPRSCTASSASAIWS